MTDSLSQISTEDLLKMRTDAAKQPSEPLQAADPAKLSTDDLLKMRKDALSAERPKTSLGASALRGAAQGASFGFADEATAGVGAFKDWAAGKLGLRGPVDLGDAYKSYIGHIRARDAAAQADNPGTYTTGAITGGAAASFVPGLGFSQGASAAQNIGKAALLGGAAGAGTSESNPTESPEALKQFGKDVGKGAAVGAALQGGFSLLGNAAQGLKPPNLEKTAAVKALKAAGYMGKDLKNMSEGQKLAAGTELLDQGIVKPFSGLEATAERAGAAKEEAGKQIGAALDRVDNLVTEAKDLVDKGKFGAMPEQAKANLKNSIDSHYQFNMQKIGDRIDQELIAPNANNPLLRGELGKLSAIADDFRGVGTTSMREGNVIKGTQGKVTNFNSDTVPQAFKQDVYNIIRGQIDEVVGNTGNLEMGVSKARGDVLGTAQPEAANQSIADAFAKAKKTYGITKQTEDVAKNRLGQTQGNREISLTDTIAGAAGLATGGPPAALAIGGLNKIARQYGDSVMAVTAQKTAELLKAAPERLGKFGTLLEAAAQEGGPALASTQIALMKNPDYQKIMADYEQSRSPIGRRLKMMGE